MSMRIFSAFLLPIALAGCGGSQADDTAGTDPLVEAETAARAELAESGMVYCALNGRAGLRPECTIERAASNDGLVITVHHPDGGFRRLLVTTDGRGLVAADGSEPAVVTPVSEREIEVAIADDRYRIPATVR